MKFVGLPNIKANQSVFIDNQLWFICGSGVCSFDISTGFTNYYQISDFELSNLSRSQTLLIFSDVNKQIFCFSTVDQQVTKLLVSQRMVTNLAAVISPTMRLCVVTTSISQINIYIDNELVLSQDSQQESVCCSLVGNDQFIVIAGLLDNNLNIYQIDDKKKVTVNRFSVSQTSGFEKQTSITSVKAFESAPNQVKILISQLYGSFKLFIFNVNSCQLSLLFQNMDFKQQISCVELTKDYVFAGGQEKTIKMLTHDGQLLQEIGRQYEEGCGICYFTVSDSPISSIKVVDNSNLNLFVLMESQKLFVLQFVNGSWSQGKFQLASNSDGIRTTLTMNDSLLIQTKQRVFLFDKNLVCQNLSVQHGCDIYNSVALDNQSFFICGDEGQIRLFQMPQWLSKRLGYEVLPSQPIMGYASPLTLSITPIYKQQEVAENNLIVPIFKQELDFQTTINTGSQLWPEVYLGLQISGANCQKLKIVKDYLYTLSLSGRNDEECLNKYLCQYSQDNYSGLSLILKQRFNNMNGQNIVDFDVNCNQIVMISELGNIQLSVDEHVHYFSSEQYLQLENQFDLLKRRLQVRFFESIFLASVGDSLFRFKLENGDLVQVSFEQYQSQITCLEVLGVDLLLGFANGDIFKNGQLIFRTCAAVTCFSLCQGCIVVGCAAGLVVLI